MRAAVLIAFLCLPQLTLPGCSKSGDAPEPAQSYVVRGQVRVMPGERPEIEIQHEAIPDFVDYRGKQAAMAAMTMPFGLAPGLALHGIAVGDKVEFTMAVDWDRKPSGYLTAIRKLPADTNLVLGR